MSALYSASVGHDTNSSTDGFDSVAQHHRHIDGVLLLVLLLLFCAAVIVTKQKTIHIKNYEKKSFISIGNERRKVAVKFFK